jgi:dihydroorotate dehydrogenase electron transfer subunit
MHLRNKMRENKMTKWNSGIVLENKRIRSTDIYIMKVRLKGDVDPSYPGQFVNIRCSKGTDPLLRRPISILRFDPAENIFEIVYEVRGKGTQYLSLLKQGEDLDVLGPLGNRFCLKEEYERIAVVGGGIGIFPLIHLLESLSEKVFADVFFGFRDSDRILWEILPKKDNIKLYISTDDKSFGYGGFITDLFKENTSDKKYDAVYTCGPKPMMKIVAEACMAKDIECFVSLEERMACGIGACLGCACRVQTENDKIGYGHVCKDGPVFNARKVVL